MIIFFFKETTSANISALEKDFKGLGAYAKVLLGGGGPAQFDANKDGYIAPDELPNPTARLRQLDTNNDGTVSKREMRKGLRARREADDS